MFFWPLKEITGFGGWTTISVIVKTEDEIEKEKLKIEMARIAAEKAATKKKDPQSAVMKALKLEKGHNDGGEVDALSAFNPYGKAIFNVETYIFLTSLLFFNK
jgi:hypothetical protein